MTVEVDIAAINAAFANIGKWRGYELSMFVHPDGRVSFYGHRLGRNGRDVVCTFGLLDPSEGQQSAGEAFAELARKMGA